MYSVIFSDERKFIFTKQQIILIPYFNVLLSSSSFLEKDIINISSSSIGFEYIHIYSTMNEIDIINPKDKYLFVLKQCDYFGYDKLKNLLEEKYGYKTDIIDIKEKTGEEIIIKMKYLGKLKIKKDIYPIIYIDQGSNQIKIPKLEINLGINLGIYFDNHTYYTYDWIYYDRPMQNSKQFITKKCNCGKNCDNSIFGHKSYTSCGKVYNIPYHCENIFIPNKGENLYYITPIYEYPDYSTDEEINDIFKKRYKEKYNIYFFKIIQNIISFNKDNTICIKIKDSYKLLSEISEEEYKNAECIIIDNEPKFNDKYLIKHIDNNLEIFELI